MFDVRLPLPPDLDPNQRPIDQDMIDQAKLSMGPQLPPPPNSSPGLVDNSGSPHRSLAQKLLPFLPAAIGTGLALAGGDKLSAFGAGLAGGSMNTLAQQAMKQRDEQHQQSQHQLKNLDDLVTKLRQLDDISDPRQHHAQIVVQDYDNMLASGKLDGKQIQRLLAAANSVGPVESMVSERQQKAALSQYEAQQQASAKIKQEMDAQGRQPYNIGGHTLNLKPETYEGYLLSTEKEKAAATAAATAEANRNWRAGFGGPGGTPTEYAFEDLTPKMQARLRNLAEKVVSNQYTPQQADGQLGHGPATYPLHRLLEDQIQLIGPVTPQKMRERLTQIDTSLNYIDQIDKMGEKISTAGSPEEFALAVDAYKRFTRGTTAILPKAFGDTGNIAVAEGERALAAVPDWERRALFPQHSRDMTDYLKNFINTNRETVLKNWGGKIDNPFTPPMRDVTGASIGVTTGNSAADSTRLPPPPGHTPSRFTIISRQ